MTAGGGNDRHVRDAELGRDAGVGALAVQVLQAQPGRVNGSKVRGAGDGDPGKPLIPSMNACSGNSTFSSAMLTSENKTARHHLPGAGTILIDSAHNYVDSDSWAYPGQLQAALVDHQPRHR